jgi:hypothetical protein
MTHEPPALLTAKQATAWTGLPTRTLARLTACGAVPSVKVNASRRYPRAALELWLAEGCPTAPGAGDRFLREIRKGVRR